MGFWIFMLCMDLLIPLTMFGFGKFFLKNGPKNMNVLFGYRTTWSMKNQETWQFAHQYCGKIWYFSGLVLLPITLVLFVLMWGKGEFFIGMAGGIICYVQLVPLVGAIVPTELALRKNFDENGVRR